MAFRGKRTSDTCNVLLERAKDVVNGHVPIIMRLLTNKMLAKNVVVVTETEAGQCRLGHWFFLSVPPDKMPEGFAQMAQDNRDEKGTTTVLVQQASGLMGDCVSAVQVPSALVRQCLDAYGARLHDVPLKSVGAYTFKLGSVDLTAYLRHATLDMRQPKTELAGEVASPVASKHNREIAVSRLVAPSTKREDDTKAPREPIRGANSAERALPPLSSLSPSTSQTTVPVSETGASPLPVASPDPRAVAPTSASDPQTNTPRRPRRPPVSIPLTYEIAINVRGRDRKVVAHGTLSHPSELVELIKAYPVRAGAYPCFVASCARRCTSVRDVFLAETPEAVAFKMERYPVCGDECDRVVAHAKAEKRPLLTSNTCDWCGKLWMSVKGERLPVCNRCREARYCNVDCQRAHWRVHKQTCRASSSSVPSSCVSSDTLAVVQHATLVVAHSPTSDTSTRT